MLSGVKTKKQGLQSRRIKASKKPYTLLAICALCHLLLLLCLIQGRSLTDCFVANIGKTTNGPQQCCVVLCGAVQPFFGHNSVGAKNTLGILILHSGNNIYIGKEASRQKIKNLDI